MAPKGPAPIRLYEIALHARPPSPAAKSKKFEKFEFGASNGLVWGQTIRQSTQLDELRRSRKVSASEDTILKSYGHLKLVPIFSWFSESLLGPPGGWCSSGAVKFEKSSGFIKSATNLRKKRSKNDKTFSSNGPNFFFEGAKLFFSWALFSFHDGLKNEYPAGTPQRTETKIASFPLSKIDKTFFFYGPNFFFWWPNFFSLGVFFSLFGGVFHFFI